jgi:hypothetical protein
MHVTVGRTVHYQSYGTPGGEYTPQPRAAIVTLVNDYLDPKVYDLAASQPNVALCVLNPTGFFFNQNVPFAQNPTPGHWNWPPKV